MTYTNAVNLAISVNGQLRLSYEYTPAIPATAKITALVRKADTGDVTLTWASTAGVRYAVDASTNLEAWSEVAPAVEATAEGSETSWTETSIPATPARRFYRVRKTN